MRLAVWKTSLGLILATLLVACGGGSSPTANSDAMTVQGYAAKGTLRNAQVDAYEINVNDGSVSSVSSATGQTDNDGNYTLSGLSKSKRYVITIKAIAGTTHIDEANDGSASTQDFSSSNFMMKAVSPLANSATSPTVTVNVTPFSHQEVMAAMAAGGNNKLTTENLAQAKSVVYTLYGFDPELASRDRAYGLLYAVSDLAKNKPEDVGCAGTSGAQATTCVVNKLAEATKVGSIQLSYVSGGSNVDVSSALKAAIDRAIIAQKINQTDVDTIRARLQCVPNAVANASNYVCTKLAVVPLDDNAQSAINQVKAVLTEITTDLKAMFSKDGATVLSTGKFNQQAYKFMQTATSVHLNASMLGKDLATVLYGVRIYQDVKNNVPNSPYTSVLQSSLGQLNVLMGIPADHIYGTACGLYQDSATQTIATSSANSNYIGCSSRYGRQVTYDSVANTSAYVEWRHGFTLTPMSNDMFSYKSRSKRTIWTCPGLPSSNGYGSAVACGTRTDIQSYEPNHLVGTVGISKVATGTYTLAIDGELPVGFVFADTGPGTDPIQIPAGLTHYKVRNMNWRFNFDPYDTLQRMDLAGQFEAYNGNSLLADVAFSNGSYLDTLGNTAYLGISANEHNANDTATIAAHIWADAPAADKAGIYQPSHLKVDGSAGYNGLTFMSGALEANFDYSNYDSRQIDSSVNSPSARISANLSVTAPDQPRLKVVVSAQGKANDLNPPAKVGLTYDRYPAGSQVPSRVVNITIDRSNPLSPTAQLSEASSALMVDFAQGKGKVYVRGVERGQLVNNVFSFSDNTFVSFDLWP